MTTITTNFEVANLIDILHDGHCKNARWFYHVKDFKRGNNDIMPLTSFVYEFFLFNSLYQIDWERTYNEGSLIYHKQEEKNEEQDENQENNPLKETQKQRIFISFLKKLFDRQYTSDIHPEYIYRSFEPLLYIETEGTWTTISQDRNISIEEGISFFESINTLKSILRNCKSPFEMPTTKATFGPIKDGLYFVNKIRNNIFHGSKKFTDANRGDQKKRIEVYDIFLKGITSLFFLTMGKNEAGCDYISVPIHIPSVSNTTSAAIINRDLIIEYIMKQMMKPSDSRLVAQFIKLFPVPNHQNHLSDKASLFYPSAGTDFITPLLLGLPYCTQFYFFELIINRHNNSQLHRMNPRRQISPLLGLRSILYKIVGTIQETDFVYTRQDNTEFLDFVYEGVKRRIHWLHIDNMEIFNKDINKNIELRFYFHRGDNWQGLHVSTSSGQHWDSEYIDSLRELIPSGSSALFVTDGLPGGFKDESASEVHKLNVPYIDQNGFFDPQRTYRCGRLSSLKKA